MVNSKVILEAKELEKMKDVTSKMSVSINSEGVIEQYVGWWNLPELDWEYWRNKYGNVARMDRILKMEKQTPDMYKVAKQADTMMIFYNMPESEVKHLLTSLGYQPKQDLLKINYNHYYPRTSHGSTLSRVVHAYLCNVMGEKDVSWDLYQEALTSDYIDIQGGTTQEGIHSGVMMATIILALKTYARLQLDGGNVRVEKGALPKQWTKMEFNVGNQGKQYHCLVTKDSATVNEGKFW